MADCPHCGISAVLYDMHRECCRARYIDGLPKDRRPRYVSTLPRDQRQAYYRGMEAQEGREAVLQFIEAVNRAAKRRADAEARRMAG